MKFSTYQKSFSFNTILPYLIALIVVFAAATTAFSAQKFIHSFGGYGSSGGKFLEPYGIAILNHSTLIVSDAKRAVIERFKADGTYIGEFANRKNLKKPMGMFVDVTGKVFVADFGLERVLVFNSKGVLLKTIGTDNGYGKLRGPADVTKDSDGNIYVADMLGHNIKKFTDKGEYILTIGEEVISDEKSGDKKTSKEPQDLTPKRPGLDPQSDKFLEILKLIPGKKTIYGDYEFRFPTSVAIFENKNDNNEELYISGGFNSFVSVYSLDGIFIRKLTGQGKGNLKLPSAIAFYKDTIFVSDFKENRVFSSNRLGGTGPTIGTNPKGGIGNTELNGPTDIAIDKDGNIYIVDSLNRRVKVFGELLP